MIIVGAKGFAKEVLEILYKQGITQNLYFYDDVSTNVQGSIYQQFPILQSEKQAFDIFKNIDSSFTLGIGIPKIRFRLFEKFSALGGQLTSTVSRNADIGSFGISIGKGCNILDGVKISNDVKIGVGVILYYNSVITHDVEVGDFVEISPNAILLGRCKIGNFTHIGAGAIIFPDVIIGDNVIIGSGAVVRQNVPDNCVAVGIPAKVIKKN